MPGRPDPRRDRLKQTWAETFGSPPPPYLSVTFMARALAHAAQCKRHGGLPSATRRRLRRIAGGAALADAGAVQPGTGAHLVREWNGRTYQVEVLAKGYRMDGRTWGSLSAIAKHITGAQWSGPRFFGLTRRAGAGDGSA